MKTRKCFSLVVGAVALFAGGCATMAKGPSFAEAKARTKPGHAIVYVFRKYAEPTAWGATIHVDDREGATLNQEGFTWAHVTPGKHRIRAVWPVLSSQKDSFIELADAKPGKTYFFELTGISRMDGATFVGTGMAYSFKLGSGFRQLPPEVAEPVVSECRFQKSETQDQG